MLSMIDVLLLQCGRKVFNGILTAEQGGLDMMPSETVPPLDEVTSVEETVTWVGQAIGWNKDYSVDVLLPMLIKLAIAVVIFMVGRIVLKKAVRFLDKSLHKGNTEEGTIHFLCSVANGAGMVLLIFMIAYYLKFGTGAIVAMLGSAGLALSLALQESLSNFAGGIMLLLTKPFRAGDYICVLGNEGFVTKLDIVYTTLVTGDNRTIVMPNGSLANANIVNVTNEPERRIDIMVGVDYDADILEVKDVLMKIAKAEQRILQDKEVSVYVDQFGASSIDMGMRVWVKTEDYWNVKWALQERIKVVFDEKHISIPFNRVDVKVVSDEETQEKQTV